jgi:hypothetical protein
MKILQKEENVITPIDSTNEIISKQLGNIDLGKLNKKKLSEMLRLKNL